MEALVIPDLPLDEVALDAVDIVAGDATAIAQADATAGHGGPTSGGLTALAAAEGVSLVPMAAPTSTDARLELVGAAATSFVYCVAVTGVTGARSEIDEALPLLIERLRVNTAAVLAVGFGISTAEQAARVAGLADGVIIGSALIDAIARSAGSGADADAACRAAGDLVRGASAAIAAG